MVFQNDFCFHGGAKDANRANAESNTMKTRLENMHATHMEVLK